jgi:hypothetical protein
MIHHNNKGNKVSELVHLALLLIGTVILMVSFFLLPDLKEGLKGILQSLGTAFLASSFIGLFNKHYLADETTDMRKEWGLVNIYKWRMSKDGKINECINNGAKKIDGITQGGLKDLRNNAEVRLKERLAKGLEMRLLIPMEGHEDLEAWRRSLPKEQKDHVTIRKYEGSPQELYFRVDDILVVGPYHVNVPGPRNITYEFNVHSNGGEIYTTHFEDLWNRSLEGEIT